MAIKFGEFVTKRVWQLCDLSLVISIPDATDAIESLLELEKLKASKHEGERSKKWSLKSSNFQERMEPAVRNSSSKGRPVGRRGKSGGRGVRWNFPLTPEDVIYHLAIHLLMAYCF